MGNTGGMGYRRSFHGRLEREKSRRVLLFVRGRRRYAGPPTSHMVVQARSKNIMGPWENAPFNPLLRTESRNENGGVKGMALLLIRKMDGYLCFPCL